MQLMVLGLNHKTAPVAVRERFSIAREDVSRGLRHLHEYEEINEAAVLSTCNRSELYAVVDDAAAMVSFYQRHRGERLEQVRQALADGALGEDDPVEGVLTRVYADVPQSVWPAARLSIRAQLSYLGVSAPDA